MARRRPAFGAGSGGGLGIGMTDTPDPIDEKASRDATDWLLLLQEEPDDPDVRRRFDAWRNASPAHDAAWAATRHTADAIAAAPPAYAARWLPAAAGRRTEDAASHAARPTPAANARRIGARGARRRPGLRVAALAAAACLVVVLAPDLALHLRADVVTGTAEVRTIRLDDGSTVVLAPDSAVTVRYRARERRVDLLAGEAFFEVARDAARPFAVVARDVQTTVLGTAFNVLREDGAVTVSLAHGRVHVGHDAASPPVSEALAAGQIVQVGRAGEVVRGSAPPSQIAAWRRGQLIAQDQPMAAVVDRLRRYYGGTIILTDRALADRPVTGVYNLADPVDALRGIAGAHAATVRRITPWVLLISDG